MSPGNFNEHFAKKELVEDVAAQHVEEFAVGMAAAEFQALTDHVKTARRHGGQGLTNRKHRVAAIERIEGDGRAVAIAMNVRAGQEETITFVDCAKIAGNPDLLADSILLRGWTEMAQRAVERTKRGSKAETDQQSYTRNG